MFANRSEKAPFTSDSMAPGRAQRTAASMRPVADELLTSTGRAVPNMARSPGCTRAKSCSNASPRCGIIGCSIASSTGRRTSVGPGRKKVPNPEWWLIWMLARGRRW